MNPELIPYFDRELIFIHREAKDFLERQATKDRASALKITEKGSDDPHVDRIIQAFALIAGRIQHKLDEEFPEITRSLLEILYPHLLRPVPPMAVVQFAVDPVLSKKRNGELIPRGTLIYSPPVNGVQCRFRTAYSTRLWPLEVMAAKFGNSSDVPGGIAGEDARYALRIELKVQDGGKLSDLNLKKLRFRIGADGKAAHWLYELLFTRVRRVLLRPLDKDGRPDGTATPKTLSLPPAAIRPVGFARSEALLPVAETSFQGYRLLQEYFCYPQKFLFFDVRCLKEFTRGLASGRFEIVLLVDSLEQNDRALLLAKAVTKNTFQLGCTPTINLFDTESAEPIRLSHTKTEYPVIPSVYSPLGLEVYSVDRVVSLGQTDSETKEYRPFYSFKHGLRSDPAETPGAFWSSSRKRSMRSGDAGSDVYLSFVDHDFRLSKPALETVTVNITCTNRDLISQFKARGEPLEFDLESALMVSTSLVHGPTETVRPASRGDLQWRLISHLSLNHLSLVDGGVDALREILRLYDPASSESTDGQIAGLWSVRSNRKIARLNSEHGVVFCPGVKISVVLDEEKFSDGSAYLLASVLERFFGLYCAVNSFTQLHVSTRQRKGVVWKWPIRSGEQTVL